MRLVIQRVSRASVSISGKLRSSIGRGLLVLAGIEDADSAEDADRLAGKLAKLRIFSDDAGQMNLSVAEIGGEVLVVSQFTLFAATKKGNRPSFIRAARPEKAIPLYEHFLAAVERELQRPPACGEFGADMQIELVNDGPVTILMDSKSRE